MRVSVSKQHEDCKETLNLFITYFRKLSHDDRDKMDKIMDSYLEKIARTEAMLEILSDVDDLKGYVLLTKVVNNVNIFTDNKNSEIAKLGFPKECYFKHFILRME